MKRYRADSTEPGQTIDGGLSPGAIITTGDITANGRNMGGFGLSEATITIQAGVIMQNYLWVVLLIVFTQF